MTDLRRAGLFFGIGLIAAGIVYASHPGGSRAALDTGSTSAPSQAYADCSGSDPVSVFKCRNTWMAFLKTAVR